MIYQAGKIDQYRHRYHYDANNRLVRAFTSDNDGLTWELDAKYFYYLHGALARTELGHDKVQGTDYAYNLQGWLKGVNSAVLDKNRDVGHDAANGDNQFFGEDAFGFQLGYFKGDYTPIGAQTNFANTENLQDKNIDGNGIYHSLFNGNISHMVTAMRKSDETILDILGNNYKYDQLQRIKAVDAYYESGFANNNEFSQSVDLYHAVGANGAYQERYTFDENGNILELSRNGSGRDGQGGTISLKMDIFSYNYYDQSTTTSTNSNPINTNRLAQVSDAATNDPYSTDIDPGQDAENYSYDASGQLIADKQENIEKIEWTVTGKVKLIHFTPGLGKNDIRFLYDAMDRRIAKLEYVGGKTNIKYTYYSYDASGNVLATYQRNTAIELGTQGAFYTYSDQLLINDHHIYGSSRIGVENQGQELVHATIRKSTSSPSSSLEEGTNFTWINITNANFDYTLREVDDKNYELNNHLNSILVTVTDRKLAGIINSDNNGFWDYYSADVVSYADFSPYGVMLDQRHGDESGRKVRYGFQGQELDDEIKGEGNSYNYEYRMHDPRIGRFFAVDPLTKNYPWYTPYSFSGNKVIAFVEWEGLEEAHPGIVKYYNVKVVNGKEVYELSHVSCRAILRGGSIIKNGKKIYGHMYWFPQKDTRIFTWWNADGTIKYQKLSGDYSTAFGKYIGPTVKADLAELITPNPQSQKDYEGIVQNATEEDYDENFGLAFWKDATAEIWNAFYDPVTDGAKTLANPEATMGEKVEATINIIVTLPSPAGG